MRPRVGPWGVLEAGPCPCGTLSDVTMKVKGVGCDDARTRAVSSDPMAAPPVGTQGRVPFRVPLLYSVVMPNRWVRSRAAWGSGRPWLWAHRSSTFPWAPQEASKHWNTFFSRWTEKQRPWGLDGP